MFFKLKPKKKKKNTFSNYWKYGLCTDCIRAQKNFAFECGLPQSTNLCLWQSFGKTGKLRTK